MEDIQTTPGPDEHVDITMLADDAERAAAALERELQAVMKRSFCGRCGRTLVQLTAPTYSPTPQGQLLRSSMIEHLFQTQRTAYVEAIGATSRTVEDVQKRNLQQQAELEELRQQLRQREERISSLEHKLLLTFNAAKSIAVQAQEYRNQQQSPKTRMLLARSIDGALHCATDYFE